MTGACTSEISTLFRFHRAPQIVEKADEEAKMFLDAAKNCVERKKISVNIIVHRGEDPAQFIIEEAEKLKADIIVMGRHGKKKA